MAKAISGFEVLVKDSQEPNEMKIDIRNIRINLDNLKILPPMPVIGERLKSFLDFLKITLPIPVLTEGFEKHMGHQVNCANAIYMPVADVPTYEMHNEKEMICLNHYMMPLTSEYAIHALFHELCHASGAVGRLEREAIVKLENYIGDVSLMCREELTAEAGAAIISRKFGLMNSHLAVSHRSYMDYHRYGVSTEVYEQAIEDAHKASEYVLKNWLSLDAMNDIIGQRYSELYERVG